MNNAYNNKVLDDQSKKIGTSIFLKKIINKFSRAMKKELSFDTVKTKANTIKIVRQPEAIYAPLQKYKKGSKTIESITLLGVRVHLLTETRLHDYIANVIEQGRKELILNVNVHCYNMIFKNPWMKKIINRANLTFCDGAGVMLGARLMGKKIPQRITYADWMWNFSEFANKKGYSFFFLGAKPGIAEKAAQKLQERHPGLKITTHHGYFDKSADSAENQEIIQKINASKANILILGFGMPLQEKWLEENQEKLKTNIALTGGAAFDYISGELKRGPRWMTDNGMEWLARLLIEPKRLWKRYIIGNTVFIFKVILERLNNIMGNLQGQFQQGMQVILPKPALAPANKKLDVIVNGTGIRRHPRLELQGYHAEIADDNITYTASIQNVSLKGIQLQKLPEKFQTNKADQFNIIICNFWDSVCYKLTVQREWINKNGSYIAAGFSIINAPTNWTQLIQHEAPA